MCTDAACSKSSRSTPSRPSIASSRAVQRGPRYMVELRGARLVAAGGQICAQYGEQVLVGRAQQPVQLPLGERLHLWVVPQQPDQAAQMNVLEAYDGGEFEGVAGVGHGVGDVLCLAQTGGHVVPDGALPGGGHHGLQRP